MSTLTPNPNRTSEPSLLDRSFMKRKGRSPWLFALGLVALASAAGIFLFADHSDDFDIESFADRRKLADAPITDADVDGRITQCQAIDRSKTQIILLVMGTVRSFMNPVAYENYYRNQVRSIEIRSNAQIHQLWYFASDDVDITSESKPKTDPGYPTADLQHLRQIQKRYGAPVMEFYPAAVSFPENFDANPYNRNCPAVSNDSMKGMSPKSGYAKNTNLQNGFQLVQDYASKCNVKNYDYFMRTRPDIVCSTPAVIHFAKIKPEQPKGHFIHDATWAYSVADYLFAMDRTAAEQLFLGGSPNQELMSTSPNYNNNGNFVDNFYKLPCEATPPGPIHNPEFFLGAVLKQHKIPLVPEELNMCGLGRGLDRGVCRRNKCYGWDVFFRDAMLWPLQKLRI